MRRCSSVTSIPEFDQMVLFVRHAERLEITDNRTHAAVMLTDQGRADSKVLGRVLGNRFRKTAVWHSPVPRCGDTAGCMVSGMKETACSVQAAGPLAWLSGDFFRADPAWVNQEVVESSENFFRKWSGDRYPADRIMPMKDAADFELECARRQMETSGSPVIVDVTHDWNIMVLREKCLAMHFTEVGLPDFLDSAAVLRQGSRLSLWSHGRLSRIGT